MFHVFKPIEMDAFTLLIIINETEMNIFLPLVIDKVQQVTESKMGSGETAGFLLGPESSAVPSGQRVLNQRLQCAFLPVPSLSLLPPWLALPPAHMWLLSGWCRAFQASPGLPCEEVAVIPYLCLNAVTNSPPVRKQMHSGRSVLTLLLPKP